MIYYNGEVRQSYEEVMFDCRSQLWLRMRRGVTIDALYHKIYRKIKLSPTQQIEEVTYRYPLIVGNGK